MRIQILRLAALLVVLTPIVPAEAQTVVQSRGVDSRVDYAALQAYGPWDDRNYQLTREDLALLGADEEKLSEAIPAFYRVELRKRMPDLPRTGPLQYPKSALPRFLVEYGGFLVDGKIYQQGERRNGRFHLILEEGVEEKEFLAQRALRGEARVTSPNGAAESAVAFHPADTDLVIAGSNGPGSGQNMHYSTDGGETWNSASLPMGGTCCDPTVAWSSDGGFAYTATLGNGVYFYRSADNGQTWTDLGNAPGAGGDPRREFGAGSSDKEYIHVDTYPTSPHKDNIYVTWHEGNVMQFARSTDFGNNFTTQSFSSAGPDQGIGSDITSDQNGHVYYFWPTFNSQKIKLRRSTDGGVTFGATVDVADTEAAFEFPLPSMESRLVFVYVSAATDFSAGPYSGSIYAAWTDNTGPTNFGNPAANHGRIQVAYSRDAGATWTVTTPHETGDANSVDRWHQWLAVGPDGKVYVLFYDTRRDPTRASVDVFFSMSEDGAQTWSTPERLTSEQSPNIGNFFEFGDYNGMDVVMNDLIGIYTDNRDESGGSGESVDVYVVGREVTGGASAIFADGFESGNLSSWNGTGN